MNTFTVVALTFLICVTVLCTTEGRKQLRCRCIVIYSGKNISIEKVDSLDTIAAGPHCKNLEIIVTVKHKSKQVCLNPSYAWVKSLIEEWNKKSDSVQGSMNNNNTLVAYLRKQRGHSDLKTADVLRNLSNV